MNEIPRPIWVIADEIWLDWGKIGKGVNYAAKPYLEAMGSLDKVTDKYAFDKADSIVLYFLSNAKSYRGEKAKALKAELKAMLGEKP